MNSTEIRTQLVEALRLDLVGPTNDHAFAHELLPQSPRPWYLTGFLVPSKAERKVRESGDDEMAEEAPERVENADDTDATDQQARTNYLPSSIGLTALAKPETKTIDVVVRWGDYHWEAEEASEEPDEDAVNRKFEEDAGKVEPPEEAGQLPIVEKTPRPKNGYRRECREEMVTVPIREGIETVNLPNERRAESGGFRSADLAPRGGGDADRIESGVCFPRQRPTGKGTGNLPRFCVPGGARVALRGGISGSAGPARID